MRNIDCCANMYARYQAYVRTGRGCLCRVRKHKQSLSEIAIANHDHLDDPIVKQRTGQPKIIISLPFSALRFLCGHLPMMLSPFGNLYKRRAKRPVFLYNMEWK